MEKLLRKKSFARNALNRVLKSEALRLAASTWDDREMDADIDDRGCFF
jgi:hypothetical protein